MAMDVIVWALVHANTPGRVNESANELEQRVKSMRCSAGSADGLEYWGFQLLRAHERTELALDDCALALAMSQHVKLGSESRVAELGPDLLESIFGLVRSDAAAVAASAREALCALRTCCIYPRCNAWERTRAHLRVLHFLEAHALGKAHFARVRRALKFCDMCGCHNCTRLRKENALERAGGEPRSV